MSRPSRETFQTRSRSNRRAAASHFIRSNSGRGAAPRFPDFPSSTYMHLQAIGGYSYEQSKWIMVVDGIIHNIGVAVPTLRVARPGVCHGSGVINLPLTL